MCAWRGKEIRRQTDLMPFHRRNRQTNDHTLVNKAASYPDSWQSQSHVQQKYLVCIWEITNHVTIRIDQQLLTITRTAFLIHHVCYVHHHGSTGLLSWLWTSEDVKKNACLCSSCNYSSYHSYLFNTLLLTRPPYSTDLSWNWGKRRQDKKASGQVRMKTKKICSHC